MLGSPSAREVSPAASAAETVPASPSRPSSSVAAASPSSQHSPSTQSKGNRYISFAASGPGWDGDRTAGTPSWREFDFSLPTIQHALFSAYSCLREKKWFKLTLKTMQGAQVLPTEEEDKKAKREFGVSLTRPATFLLGKDGYWHLLVGGGTKRPSPSEFADLSNIFLPENRDGLVPSAAGASSSSQQPASPAPPAPLRSEAPQPVVERAFDSAFSSFLSGLNTEIKSLGSMNIVNSIVGCSGLTIGDNVHFGNASNEKISNDVAELLDSIVKLNAIPPGDSENPGVSRAARAFRRVLFRRSLQNQKPSNNILGEVVYETLVQLKSEADSEDMRNRICRMERMLISICKRGIDAGSGSLKKEEMQDETE